MASLRFISAFAGIGGFELGLDRSGHRCVGQIEIDPYCNQVLAKHWPSLPRWPDIRVIDATELPQADLWTAGFPCQDISNAGKREGIRGARSGLFFDLMRAFRVVRPGYLLLENVAAILAARRGMGAVLGELAESGTDAEWDCIPAAAVGAPHIRDRVFIFAYAACARSGRLPVRSRGSFKTAANINRSCEAGLSAYTTGRRLQKRIFKCEDAPAVEFTSNRRTSLGTYLGEAWEAEPGEGWLDDRIPPWMAEVYSRLLGNAVVPQVAEWIGRRLAEACQEGG